MMKHEKERKLKEHLKANYEAYIQQLKVKPAPDLIEMASEIAAAKFIYEELEVEGAFSEYADYLLQFENPLEVLKDGWISELTVRQSDALSDVLWDMAEKNFGVCKYQMAEDEMLPANSQGVTMC